MLVSARNIARASLSARPAVAAVWQQAPAAGSSECTFASKAGRVVGGRKRGGKPPGGVAGGDDEAGYASMDEASFQQRLQQMMAAAGGGPSGPEDATAALKELDGRLEATLAHIRNRMIMDYEEDRVDFLDKSEAEVQEIQGSRDAARRAKWARWVETFPKDAAQLSEEAGWAPSDIPDNAVQMYANLRSYDGIMEELQERSARGGSD